MGSVYEARHLRIPKRFAVKFLRIGLTENAEALERFRREAEVVAGLDHPNVVEIYDYNVTEDGSPYIVLEYLDGNHLGAHLRDAGKIALDDALPILSAVGGALVAAHARNVIHRDLKPENIVLCADGCVKVVDFGVAKLRGAPELTAVNTIVGTVPYMAPEQLMGGVLDARVDQYALAIIAYEMLAGEMAFDGSGAVADVARRVLTHVPPFVAGVPQAVNEVLFRGMARAADERFAQVADFIAALDAGRGVKEPSLPVEAVAPDELPPLAGEATRITITDDAGQRRGGTRRRRRGSAGAAARGRRAVQGAAHADDPVAAAAARRPDLRDAGGGGQRRGHRRAGAAAVAVDAGRAEAERRLEPRRRAAPLNEPRVTLKTMNAATAPTGWESVTGQTTRPLHLPARWLWLIVGLLVGILAALSTVYFLRH